MITSPWIPPSQPCSPHEGSLGSTSLEFKNIQAAWFKNHYSRVQILPIDQTTESDILRLNYFVLLENSFFLFFRISILILL